MHDSTSETREMQLKSVRGAELYGLLFLETLGDWSINKG